MAAKFARGQQIEYRKLAFGSWEPAIYVESDKVGGHWAETAGKVELRLADDQIRARGRP